MDTQCSYYNEELCLSCDLMEYGYKEQIAIKEKNLLKIKELFPDVRILKTITSERFNFRNKAKLVVGGTSDKPTLGILNEDKRGVDLEKCPLYQKNILTILPLLRKLIIKYNLIPYNVKTKNGELKYIIVTSTLYNNELMVRFVCRSLKLLNNIKELQKELINKFENVKVVTLNIQDKHTSTIEGIDEIVITKHRMILEKFNKIKVFIKPKCFFQTNTYITKELYNYVAKTIKNLNVDRVYDLFCGVGGFSFHVAPYVKKIIGVDNSIEAIDSAKYSQKENSIGNVQFNNNDVTDFIEKTTEKTDLIIVNPPQRGLGAELTEKLNSKYIIYSSCNYETFLEDIRLLKNYTLTEIRIFDMFPNISHFEVVGIIEKNDIKSYS